MELSLCPQCGSPSGSPGSLCEPCKTKSPEAAAPEKPSWQKRREEETARDRPIRRPFPARRVAWIGFGSVVLGVVLLVTILVLGLQGIAKNGVTENLGVAGVGLVGFVGLPCLVVPVIARIAAALDRRRRFKMLLYRGGMTVIGFGLCAVSLYRFKEGFSRGAAGAALLAFYCLWYGAVRGENPTFE